MTLDAPLTMALDNKWGTVKVLRYSWPGRIAEASMHNLYANFVKILEICKDFSKNLVNELGNIPRPRVVPRFSDLEVVALSLTAEHLNARPMLIWASRDSLPMFRLTIRYLYCR